MKRPAEVAKAEMAQYELKQRLPLWVEMKRNLASFELGSSRLSLYAPLALMVEQLDVTWMSGFLVHFRRSKVPWSLEPQQVWMAEVQQQLRGESVGFLHQSQHQDLVSELWDRLAIHSKPLPAPNLKSHSFDCSQH